MRLDDTRTGISIGESMDKKGFHAKDSKTIRILPTPQLDKASNPYGMVYLEYVSDKVTVGNESTDIEFCTYPHTLQVDSRDWP